MFMSSAVECRTISFSPSTTVPLDMLSPTRSSAQTILKSVVATASTVLQESASTSAEHKEESNELDESEPLKKKFKDDTETEVSLSDAILRRSSSHLGGERGR